MAYLSKETLLSAYKVLSTLSDDPTLQGATQKVSAIRYFLALDMFYKKYNRECNTRNSDDKTAFVDFVNTIVAVDNCYTTNFYAPLAFHQGDSAVGSNFYSVGAVKNSLTNPAIKINYPQRGSKPLFEIQNGVLFEREDLLQNFDFYVPNNKFKCALVLWICRERYVRIEDIYSTLKTQIDILFTEKTAEILLPSEDYFVEATQDIGISAEFTKANITSEDIQKLFYKNEMKKQTSFPLQQIFYGAPGTGKSHKVKEVTDSIASEFVFRTTFHPDSDYSTFVGAYKPTMKQLPIYNQQTGAQIGVEDKIVYSFVPQAFLKAYVVAWKNPNEKVFLIIEEINRGNCAQIFGDIFQLLDRNDNGQSEYPIKADQDIRDHLAKEFAGVEGLEDNIQSGEELMLPSNLHIWATMNTSDQSLFPIDSAFKRRWDWKYMPIHNAGENWTITLSDIEYDWWDFVEKINKVIGDMTSSEDKKLGYFFCKACNGKINAEKFVNKVVFYLWNDVFKDYELSNKAFDDKDGSKLNFNKFYTPSGEANEETIIKFLENLEVEISEYNHEGEDDDELEEDANPVISQRRQKCKEFWTNFLEYTQNNSEYQNIFGGRKTPTPTHWYAYNVFNRPMTYLCIDQFRGRDELSISITMDKPSYIKLEESYKAEIEQKLQGISLEWTRDLQKSTKKSSIKEVIPVTDFDDSQKQQELFNHIIDRLLRMYNVFNEYLTKLPK